MAYIAQGVPVVTDATTGEARTVLAGSPTPAWYDGNVNGVVTGLLRRGPPWTQAVLSPDGQWLLLVQAPVLVGRTDSGDPAGKPHRVELPSASPSPRRATSTSSASTLARSPPSRRPARSRTPKAPRPSPTPTSRGHRGWRIRLRLPGSPGRVRPRANGAARCSRVDGADHGHRCRVGCRGADRAPHRRWLVLAQRRGQSGRPDGHGRRRGTVDRLTAGLPQRRCHLRLRLGCRHRPGRWPLRPVGRRLHAACGGHAGARARRRPVHPGRAAARPLCASCSSFGRTVPVPSRFRWMWWPSPARERAQ